MKTTQYFREQVLRKRPYLKKSWFELALVNPDKKEIQSDERVRYWVYIEKLGKYLRVVTLSDGETVHNAFPDRDYKK
jgi:hypothetical protein